MSMGLVVCSAHEGWGGAAVPVTLCRDRPAVPTPGPGQILVALGLLPQRAPSSAFNSKRPLALLSGQVSSPFSMSLSRPAL